MRPLLVKRHTAPESGFFRFFPPCKRRRRQQSVSCPDVISVFGCHPTWLHHTRMEVQSPCAWRLHSRLAGSLCERESMPCPHTVLRKSLAASHDLASSCRARGRGSTRNRRRPSPSGGEPERLSNQGEGLREQRPMHAASVQRRRRVGTSSVLDAGSSLWCRVRRRAQPLCSLRC
jgi:hypothetical protein